METRLSELVEVGLVQFPLALSDGSVLSESVR